MAHNAGARSVDSGFVESKVLPRHYRAVVNGVIVERGSLTNKPNFAGKRGPSQEERLPPPKSYVVPASSLVHGSVDARQVSVQEIEGERPVSMYASVHEAEHEDEREPPLLIVESIDMGPPDLPRVMYPKLHSGSISSASDTSCSAQSFPGWASSSDDEVEISRPSLARPRPDSLHATTPPQFYGSETLELNGESYRTGPTVPSLRRTDSGTLTMRKDCAESHLEHSPLDKLVMQVQKTKYQEYTKFQVGAEDVRGGPWNVPVSEKITTGTRAQGIPVLKSLSSVRNHHEERAERGVKTPSLERLVAHRNSTESAFAVPRAVRPRPPVLDISEMEANADSSADTEGDVWCELAPELD